MSIGIRSRVRRVGLAGVVVAVSAGIAAGSAAAAPRNDDFADAVPLRVGKTVNGSITGATKQRGEPQHARSLATRSVWYTFKSRRKVALKLDTCRSNFDSVIAVYTGRSLRSLRPVDFNNDGCGRSGAGSRVTFTARPGRVYRIAVAGFAPSGRFALRTTKIDVPPNDDFVDAVAIRLGEPINGTTRGATRELDEPAHANNEALTVWFKLTLSSLTNVEVSTCGNPNFTFLTVYTGNRVGSLTRVAGGGGGCSARFAAQPGVAYRIVVEDGGTGGGVRLIANAVAAP